MWVEKRICNAKGKQTIADFFEDEPLDGEIILPWEPSLQYSKIKRLILAGSSA